MSERVSKDQRFSKENPCPICGGGDNDRRGNGDRCFGFISEDHEWARCTREEHAGSAKYEKNTDAYVHKLTGECKCGIQHGPEEAAATLGSGPTNGHKKISSRAPLPETRKTLTEESYIYNNADGQPHMMVKRIKGKGFRQKRYEGGEWIWGLDGVEPILYHLDELEGLEDGAEVVVAEGEKDVDRLRAEGFNATTNPMGAEKWKEEYAQPLRRFKVYVIPDNDEAGEKHAEQVAASIPGAVIVHLPDLPPRGDVSDFLDAGHTAEDLRQLIDEAPEWTPSPEPAASNASNTGPEKAKTPPVADRLVDYVQEAGWPLFVDQHAESHTLVDGQAVPISRLNRFLTKLLYAREGKAPSNDGLIGARRVLDMLAHDSGEVRELHTRAAFHESAVFYQLAPGRVVRVDENGWELDLDPPVYFRAVKNLQPLPDPVQGGKLEDLEEFVNLKTERDKRLFKTYVALTPLAHIPRPILQATGTHGAGKTTASRVPKRLLDPTSNETVTIDKRDFLQKAAHCYILMLDNQNSLPEWFQDTLCRLVTGESDSKRVLYSDDDDLVWSMKRAVLLNGINPPSERGDVQDRTLPIELERLDRNKRLAEDDFWMQFSLKQPELLGAVFSALSGALQARHTVKLDERPRLADWGLYAAALYESQGWGVDTFVEDWKLVEEAQNQGTLDGSIVAQAVIHYMKDKDRVEMTAAKLHEAIEKGCEDALDLGNDKTWPKTGRTLWKRIREVTPLLEAHGIRAYRSSSNKTGRPIILDTDFTDPEDPEDAKYAKYGDDNGKEDPIYRPPLSSPEQLSSPLSSPDTPDTYRKGDDNASGGRYFGVTLASHTSDSKEKKREQEREQEGEQGQGESRPDLSSPSSPTGEESGEETPCVWFDIDEEENE